MLARAGHLLALEERLCGKRREQGAKGQDLIFCPLSLFTPVSFHMKARNNEHTVCF